MEERTEALYSAKDDFYKVIGEEQGKQIDKEKLLQRIREENGGKTLERLVQLESYDKNVIKAISCRVIPVPAYAINVCQFT